VYKIYVAALKEQKLGIYSYLRRCKYRVKNISAQKASQKDGAWLQKENGYC